MKPLSICSKISWQIAAYEAGESNHRYIEKEHLLVGILSLEKVIANGPQRSGIGQDDWQTLKSEYSAFRKVLHSFGIGQTKLRRTIRSKIGKGNYTHSEKIIHRSEECKKVFEKAATLSESSEITILHLTAAIAENPGDMLKDIFRGISINLAELGKALLSPPEKEIAEGKEDQPGNDVPESYLERYGRDLTLAARDGKFGPFVGRRNELLQILQTLARSMKSNPVLVGEAGVGKTAIVEALAVRAVQGKDPQVLSGKRIIELNIGAILGGTKYRGEFEERLTRIIQETKADPNIILFIDEIHNLVGAGSVGGGSMDAANIMKPALARGDIKCIGATTTGEYRRYIEADPALERRFEKILVNEPSRDEAIEILKGIRPKWEKHFGKKITDKALEAAVDLSIRFDTDHHLPDKAVDLVDKAGARVQMPFLSMVQKLKTDAVQPCDTVEGHTIAEVLSEKMGLPLEIIQDNLAGASGSRLSELNGSLKKKIIGQDDAIDKVSSRLLMAHAGMGRKSGPLAVFLFMGPTGVGKTELVKSLAEFLFGSESSLIRLDMSEYMEEHSVAKLIGSPPGYAGYDEEGQLTSKLRSKPYSVVLLDEAEKAHPKIFDLFLQLFDAGRLTDAKGRTVDAKNAIFILTSNLRQETQNKRNIGFIERPDESESNQSDNEAKQYFRPELLNRIDEQIIFKPLGEEAILNILKNLLAEISTDIKGKYDVSLKFTEDVEAFLLREGYSLKYGARELRRTVERHVQIPLSKLVLSGKLKEQKSWLIVFLNDVISIVSSDEP